MKILVLGVTGMLGHKLFQVLRDQFEGVKGLAYENTREPPYHRVPFLQGEDVRFGVDAAEFSRLRDLLQRERPDYILNAVGIIRQRKTASSFVSCIELNSLLPHKLALFAEAWGGRVIHFSTDCVFDGARGGYTEEDEATAKDLYGRSKHLGEVQGEQALTLRTSIIGRELTHHKSLLDWFLSQRGRTIRGYQRVIYSGVTTNQMAEVVAMVIRRYPALSGLYQVVADPISKHDLLCLAREAFKMDVDIVPENETCSDRSMKGDKFRAATGYVSPPWPQLMAHLADDPTPYYDWGIHP